MGEVIFLRCVGPESFAPAFARSETFDAGPARKADFRFIKMGEAQPHTSPCAGAIPVQNSRASPEARLAAKLGRQLLAAAPCAEDVRNNDFLLRFRIPPYELTVFADGRAIVKGTQDPAVARSLYARYVGA